MKRITKMLLVLLVVSTCGAETTAFALQDISWSTQASSMRGRNGQRISYFCPPGGSISSSLWGSDRYTDDSSICSAAVHSGLIDTYNGGEVTIEIRPGASSFNGSRRNKVTSKSYGSFQGSFVFVTGDRRDTIMEERRDERRERHAVPYEPGISVPLPGGMGTLNVPAGPDHEGRQHSSQANQIDWATAAGGDRGKIGYRVRYYCPPGGEFGSVWGSGLYTDDSSVCTAAVHAGLITTYNGGEVLIEIRPGAGSYQGSRKNGVSSQGYGSFDGSFIFVR